MTFFSSKEASPTSVSPSFFEPCGFILFEGWIHTVSDILHQLIFELLQFLPKAWDREPEIFSQQQLRVPGFPPKSV